MQAINHFHRLFGVLSTSKESEAAIRNTLEFLEPGTWSLHLLDSRDTAIEFLNYELPDLIFIDLAHLPRNITQIEFTIREDPWVNGVNFIGLHGQPSVDYVRESARFRLDCILPFEAKDNLRKATEAILRSRSNLVDTHSVHVFQGRPSGEIVLDNDIEEAERTANLISSFLYETSRIDRSRFYSVNMGLSELLINAVEHGNCEISFEDKTRLLEAGTNMVEHIKKVTKEPKFASRKVVLNYEIHEDKSLWTITDEGHGFDVQKFLKVDPSRLFLPHGRGIMMAKSSSDELIYSKKGNQVTLVCRHLDLMDARVPAAFRDQERIKFNPGEKVFDEGEASNTLYYILSGEFQVIASGREVGYLSPTDIFMGEMSFLLNNQRSATVIAATDAELLAIPKKSFIQIIKKHPNTMVLLSRLLAKRLSMSNIHDTPQNI